MEGNIVADYKIGNTRITVKNDHYATDEECEHIYERISRIAAVAFLRKHNEKDTHAVQSEVS